MIIKQYYYNSKLREMKELNKL